MAKKLEPPTVQLSDGELARREAGRVWVRTTPLRVRFELADLVTADGHRLQITFACSVVARPEPAERHMLEEAFLAEKSSCSSPDIVRAFLPSLTAAATKVIATRPVVEWLDAKPELSDTLRKATDAAAFANGLEVIPPYQLDIASPSLQRAEQERSARELVERDQAQRLAHLRRSAEVLKEFEAIRAASPNLSFASLLSRVAASDQAGVVQGLIESNAQATADLYAVAGPCVIRITGDNSDVQEISLPASAGPFRSVQQVEIDGQPRLAIGGRAGVVLLDPAGPRTFAAPDVTSAMGFNRVVSFAGKLWASHSEVGLVAWDLASPDSPVLRITRTQIGGTPTEGPRQLRLVGNHLVFSVGPDIFFLDESLQVSSAPGRGAAEPIVSLLRTARAVLAVRASGDVEILDPNSLEVVKRDRRSARVSAAALLPFYDSPRLLLAADDGPITCLSPDDAVVTQYVSPHRGLRALTASPAHIAGVSADRQRVVLFDVSGRTPVREIHVGARVKHRVADIAFASEPRATGS